MALNSQGNASDQIMITDSFHNPKQTRIKMDKIERALQAFLISKVPKSDVYPLHIQSTRRIDYLVFVKVN